MRQSLEFFASNSALLLSQSLLLIGVLMLYGMRDASRAVTWSLGSLAFAAWSHFRPFVPWRMTVMRIAGAWNPSAFWPEEDVAIGLLNSPVRRRIIDLWTAAAALTPWLLFGLTRLLSLRPPGHLGEGAAVPYVVFAGWGAVDGLRSRVIGFRTVARQVLREERLDTGKRSQR